MKSKVQMYEARTGNLGSCRTFIIYPSGRAEFFSDLDGKWIKSTLVKPPYKKAIEFLKSLAEITLIGEWEL